MTQNKQWFAMGASDSPDCTDVMIYDDIGGYGVTAEAFVSQFNAIKTPKINVHLNTMGGGVFDGLAIYRAMEQSKANVTAYVDSIAASIGSIIALGADSVCMAANSFMMIHSPWSYVQGNAGAMRQEADILDKLGAQMAAIYAGKTGKTVEEVQSLMSKETWMNADEAKAAGFADSIDSDAADDELMKAVVIRAATKFSNLPPKMKLIAAETMVEKAKADAAKKAAPPAMSLEEFGQIKERLKLDEQAVLV